MRASKDNAPANISQTPVAVAVYSTKPPPMVIASEADVPLFSQQASIILVLVAGIFVAARFLWLPGYSLSGGEMFTVHAVRRDWSSMIAFLIEDIVHPPLYYLLLKIWMGVGGDSVLWLKLFSAFIAVATIFPFYFFCREIKLHPPVVNLGLTLFAINGHLIYNAQRLRMYSLLLFLTLFSLWRFVKFINSGVKDKKQLLILSAVNLLLVYTHYYGWLVVGAEFLFILFWERKRLRMFSIAVAVLILCFSPWAGAVANVAIKKGLGPNLAWIPRPNLSSLIAYFSTVNGSLNFPGSAFFGLFLFGYPIAFWAADVFKSTKGDDEPPAFIFWCLSLLAFLPVAIAFCASNLLPHSIFHPRYLIISAVPHLILEAIAIVQLRSRWVRTTTILLVVGWAALAGVTELNNLSRSKEMYGRDRAAWETLIHHLVQTENPLATDVNVYAYGLGAAAPARFYLESVNDTRFRIILFNDASALEGAHFWVMFREDWKMQGRRDLREFLMDKGFHVGELFEAAGRHELFLFPVWRENEISASDVASSFYPSTRGPDSENEY